MRVEKYANFITAQLNTLKEHISPGNVIHWPLVAQVAREARDPISLFIDYNIDLMRGSKNSITHYIQSKVLLINEFARQELNSLQILSVNQIHFNSSDSTIGTSTPILTRSFNMPTNVQAAFTLLPQP